VRARARPASRCLSVRRAEHVRGEFRKQAWKPGAPCFMEKREGVCQLNSERIESFRLQRIVAGAVLALLLAASLALAQRTARNYAEPEYEPPEHQVDMLHMRLEVSFVPAQGIVRGKVTHRFTPLRARVDSLFFNGPGIHVQRADWNGDPVPFTSTPDGITVRFPRPLTWDRVDSLTFVYEATPRRGIYFIGWNDSTNRSRKQIWTQGQGIDNRHWFPCCDEQNDKLTTETIITFDREYQVLSNGIRIAERENGDGTKTWHYAMTHPHSTYLVMLGIGKYGVDRRTTRRGVPINLWYYPDQPERIEPTYRYSTDMVDFIEEQTGIPYPWESYAQIPVQDFLYGAMENTTATVFGDFLFVDRRGFLDRNYIAVNVHELAHQWFGDYVTGRNGRSSWLHESFATFYSKLFLRSVYGQDYYQWNRRNEQNAALAASEKDRFPILHSRAGSDRIYSKGSAVLDMMMTVWGEDAYRRVIRSYLRKHAYGNVETNDLYQEFQDVLGVTPWWFFDQWISRGGEPQYRVTYQDVAVPGRSGRRTEIRVEQIQETDDLVGLFSMPIVFQVYYADGSMDSTRTTVQSQTTMVIVPNAKGKKIDFVLFDPGSRILKKVTFQKSFEELRAQALRAPLMIDRYDAVAAMRTLPPATKRATLVEVFSRERFFAVRGEAASQLAADDDEASREAVARALRDEAAEVRLAVFSSLGVIPESLRPRAEALLGDSSYAIVASALTKLSSEFPGRTPEYLARTRGVGGVGNQVRVLWFELDAQNGNAASLDSLVDMSGVSFEFRTRVNAFDALKRLNYCPVPVVKNLFQAMTHPNARLRGPATEVARSLYAQTALQRVFREYYRSRAWEPWQTIFLEEFFK